MLVFLTMYPYLPSTPYEPPPKEFSIVTVAISTADGGETEYYFFENNSRLTKNVFLQNKVSSTKDVLLIPADKARLEALAKDASEYEMKFPCSECSPGPSYYHIVVAPKEGGRLEFACPTLSSEPDAVSCEKFSKNLILALEEIINR
jgi:hypothetical protein